MSDNFKSCSFCGKGENKVHSMFSAGSSNICDECVCYCYEMNFGPEIAKAKRKEAKPDKEKSVSSIKLLKPVEIKNFLDEYVIGQEDAKISLAVAVYNHYKRILSQQEEDDNDDVELQKSNVLL
ncbi:MAG: ATP-dependent Clp protease ATP-binding subunit ClpX, partial [Lachnospiraceae bacterium]|nr:ATP-dependent Clp protease ATP-binding subunit ClpX [Lachnospiraceae bacterium]